MMMTKFSLTVLLYFLVLFSGFSQRLSECLSVRHLELKTDENEIAVQNAYKELAKKMGWYLIGNSTVIGKGNRGERKGKYVLFWGFDLKEYRDFYYPPDNMGGSSHALAAWEKIGSGGLPYLAESPTYTDYILLGFKKFVEPTIGEVIALRYPEIIPGKEKEFEEKLVNEWIDKFHNKIEGVNFYYYKGDRGERKDKIMYLISINSYETYNKYWSKDGVNTELINTKLEPLNDLLIEINSYFQESTVSNYTDYIIVR